MSERLQLLRETRDAEHEVTISYFLADEKKDGGKYVEVTGAVKKIDEYTKTVLMCDGTRIPMDDVIEIEGSLFWCIDNY